MMMRRPSLLSDITKMLQQYPDAALVIVTQLLREFSSVKLPKFTSSLYAVASQIYNILKAMYLASSHEWYLRVLADNPDRNSGQRLIDHSK